MSRLLGGLGFDPRWMEALTGGTAILWALDVVCGPKLLDHPGYVTLARFAPDWVWVCITGFGGCLQMIAARRNHIEARLLLTLAMGSVWLLLADGLRIGAAWSPSIATYFGPAVGNGAAMLLLLWLWLQQRERGP